MSRRASERVAPLVAPSERGLRCGRPRPVAPRSARRSEVAASASAASAQRGAVGAVVLHRAKRGLRMSRELAAALAAEHAAIFAYGPIGVHLTGAAGRGRAAAEAAHRTRRDALVLLLTAEGATPPPAAAGYALPFPVTDRAAALRLATDVEERAAAAWRAALAATEGDQRRQALDRAHRLRGAGHPLAARAGGAAGHRPVPRPPHVADPPHRPRAAGLPHAYRVCILSSHVHPTRPARAAGARAHVRLPAAAAFEESTGATWPLNIGQVYTTLSRLERDGLVRPLPENDGGQRPYEITEPGRAELTLWFATPISRTDRPRDELAIKLALALTTPGVDVRAVVQTQRTATMRTLQEYTRLKAGDQAGRPAVAAGARRDDLPGRGRGPLARPLRGEPRALRAPRRPTPRRRPHELDDVPQEARPMSVLELRDVAPHPRHRRRPPCTPCAASTLDRHARRAGRRDGPVRLGQVDAAQPRRRARRARPRARCYVEGQHLGALNRRGLAAAAPAQRRLRLPGPEPAAQPHRGGERGAAPGAGRRVRSPGRGALALAALAEVGLDRPGRPVPRRDVRRPAAAGGDRPGAGRRPPAGAGRRADRRAGLADRRGRAAAAARPGRRGGGRGAGDPRGAARRLGRPGGLPARRRGRRHLRPAGRARAAADGSRGERGMRSSTSWRTALRIARREARRAKGRSALVARDDRAPGARRCPSPPSRYDMFTLTPAEKVDRQIGAADARISWPVRRTGPAGPDGRTLGDRRQR